VNEWTRREWLARTPVAVGAGIAAEPVDAAKEPFGYCLNTSTIREQKLDMVEIVELAAKAGYTAIEPWVREIEEHAKKGGDLKPRGRRLRDRGRSVVSAIDFPEWIVDDDARRKKGLENAKRGMDLVRQIGGQRIAAPPAGATNQAVNPYQAAERYRVLLELGEQMGIVAQVELWGFSQTLGRLGETALVAIGSGHPQA